MTHVELRNQLKDRIGFLADGTTDFKPTGVNASSQSGKMYQDEHPMVTLANIMYSQPVQAATEQEFNTQLDNLKKRAVLLAINDVFEVSDIESSLLSSDDTILDRAISMRMAILVGESILASTRSTRLDSMNKQHLFLMLEGREGKFRGMKDRYEEEIRKVKDSLGQERMLDVNTLKLPNYNSDDLPLL